MHGFDVDACVGSEVPNGTNRCGQIGPLDRYERPVIDVNRIRRRRGKFVPIEPGGDPCNDRPCIRVRGGFACAVTGVEFLERGVGVVKVEHDRRGDSFVGIDLEECECLGEERLGSVIAVREAGT